MAYPVVGDVAKLDMLNIRGLAIQWLVMWQSWICSIYVAYPVVGDVAKLDMLNIATWLIQWLVMWQSWIYALGFLYLIHACGTVNSTLCDHSMMCLHVLSLFM